MYHAIYAEYDMIKTMNLWYVDAFWFDFYL